VRFSAVTTGALAGAVFEELAVSWIPAGAPAVNPRVATWEVDEARVRLPPLTGID
jgi:hypothetical protein